MRNFDEHNITDAVVDRLRNCKSPRIQAISVALVRHLHDLVREVELTQQEWEEAIRFLTRTGQACSDVRQEFILLSDTLGVSMLVDALNHRLPRGTTETTVLGPFYVNQAPQRALGDCMWKAEEGTPLLIEGCVRSVDGELLEHVMVDIWQADGNGFYDVQRPDNKLNGRARVQTDDRGRFWIYGVVPVAYPIPGDGPVGWMLQAQGRHPYRPAHVHFMLEAAGYETLVTHLFLSHSEYLDSDVVFGVKESLIERLEIVDPGVTLCGVKLDVATPVLHRDFALSAIKQTGHVGPP